MSPDHGVRVLSARAGWGQSPRPAGSAVPVGARLSESLPPGLGCRWHDLEQQSRGQGPGLLRAVHSESRPRAPAPPGGVGGSRIPRALPPRLLAGCKRRGDRRSSTPPGTTGLELSHLATPSWGEAGTSVPIPVARRPAEVRGGERSIGDPAPQPCPKTEPSLFMTQNASSHHVLVCPVTHHRPGRGGGSS